MFSSRKLRACSNLEVLMATEVGLLERQEGETTTAQGGQWTDKASGHIIAIMRAMPCHGAGHGTGGGFIVYSVRVWSGGWGVRSGCRLIQRNATKVPTIFLSFFSDQVVNIPPNIKNQSRDPTAFPTTKPGLDCLLFTLITEHKQFVHSSRQNAWSTCTWCIWYDMYVPRTSYDMYVPGTVRSRLLDILLHMICYTNTQTAVSVGS